MNILVLGRAEALEECQAKFGTTHQYFLATHHDKARPLLSSTDIVFDFLIADRTDQLKIYEHVKKAFVFLNTSAVTLTELFYQSAHEIDNVFFGFCGLPTFLNRPLLEVSVRFNEDRDQLAQLCTQLRTDFTVIDDRVGLVTPRVICMIINEAYYTVQEETASREDIDLAMRLGTNYPYGPFEWCKMIGATNVYNLLSAVYEDTKDERYKICPLLKREIFTTPIQR
jgi:3-hydroxybutyryl-CoA dehydrogenase